MTALGSVPGKVSASAQCRGQTAAAPAPLLLGDSGPRIGVLQGTRWWSYHPSCPSCAMGCSPVRRDGIAPPRDLSAPSG